MCESYLPLLVLCMLFCFMFHVVCVVRRRREGVFLLRLLSFAWRVQWEVWSAWFPVTACEERDRERSKIRLGPLPLLSVAATLSRALPFKFPANLHGGRLARW